MELLAHASAPSSRKDDERFKRQAKAYLSFDSASIVSVHRCSEKSQTELPIGVSSSAASVQHEESPLFLENTQDAWTALDSQLFAPSQTSVDQNIQESQLNESVDESLLPLPINSSIPPRVPHNALPPDESALFDASLMPAPKSRSHTSRAENGSHRQAQHVPTPSRLLRFNKHGTPSYLDDLSTICPAETPVGRVSLLRASNQPQPQDDFSSPSDDIPSQLPSTYSISDMNSDPIYGDQTDAPTSSAWGSLPRGSAPQPWTGIIEEESPLKGMRTSGKRRIQRSSPLKQTQSLESPRANMSAQIQPAHSSDTSGQNEVSSASLDRAVNLKQQQPGESVQQAFTSSFDLRYPSSSQVRGLEPDDEVAKSASGIARQEGSTFHAARSSFESDFSSAPQAQGTQSSGVDDLAVPKMLRQQSLNQLLPTTFDTKFSSSAEAPGTQPTDNSDTVVPPALRQHTLDQLLPTSFESRFSSSPEARGTPLIDRESPVDKPAEASSSASSKINLFQPREALLVTDVTTSSPLADNIVPDPTNPLEDVSAPIGSSPWRPTPSASEGSHVASEADIEVKRRKLNSLSTPKAKPTFQEREVFKSLSLQIHPPHPPTGSGEFVSHITQQLKSQFWDSAELQGKYNPSPHRELEQSERGYWQIDTRSWSPKIQIKFWVFLQSNIGSGVGGWGVWCLRENDTEADEDEDASAELGIVRVFCWGEVVGHVWLLCYVASQARLKRVESQWIDADGEVVVRI